MPDNTVNIRIGTDLSQLEGDAKKLGSALDGAAKGGIAGFEAAQQKVISLTKRVGELRNALLQTQDPAQQKQLNAALDQTRTQLGAARTQMRGMTLESREANEKVQMLAASLGVRVPQGLGQILARLPGVQQAMELAFGATIVVAFGAAIVALFPKIAEWIDQLRGVEKVNQDILNKQIELNTYLAYGGKPEVLAALTKRFNQVSNEIIRIRGEIERLQTSTKVPPSQQGGPLAGWLVGMTAAGDKVKSLKADLGPLEEAYKRLDLAMGREKLDEHNKGMEEAKKHAKELFVAQWNLNRILEQAIDWNGEIVFGYKAHTAAMRELQAAYDEEERTLENFPALITDREFALKHLPPLLQEIQARSELANEAMVKDMKAQDEAAKKALDQQKELAHGIESFIDRVFIQARSLGDVFHQFLMQTLGSFVKWISQMLASWLTGIRQVTAGGGGGGVGGGIGGLLGPILGGVFGLGGGISAMAAPGGVTAAAGQLGLPIGMGGMGLSGAGGIPSAVGGAAQGGLGQLAFHPGQFAANLATMGPLLAILGGASLMGRGGVGSGVAGGMLAAGGISYAMFGLAGLGVLPLAIGALVGGIIGMVRRGRQKQKSAALEQQFEFAGNDVLNQYELHKVDYESAISQLEGLIASGQQTLLGAGTGRWGRQGAENLTRVIQDLIARVNDLEKQRQATLGVIGGMTIPEFAVGGPVGYRLANGGILALVHPGEFVMRREAVDNLGANFLAALNRAPAFASGGPVGSSIARQHGGIHIHGNLILYPEKGMTNREAMEMVVQGFNLAMREGAL